MRLLPVFGMTVLLAGCSPQSPRGFTLPAGDMEAGKVAYQTLNCVHCHRLPDESEDRIRVMLGGPVTRVQTYGMLVSSIIDPAHKVSTRATDIQLLPDGGSTMAAVNMNATMTVQQLVDLVAYLQPLYEVVPPDGAYGYAYP